MRVRPDSDPGPEGRARLARRRQLEAGPAQPGMPCAVSAATVEPSRAVMYQPGPGPCSVGTWKAYPLPGPESLASGPGLTEPAHCPPGSAAHFSPGPVVLVSEWAGPRPACQCHGEPASASHGEPAPNPAVSGPGRADPCLATVGPGRRGCAGVGSRRLAMARPAACFARARRRGGAGSRAGPSQCGRAPRAGATLVGIHPSLYPGISRYPCHDPTGSHD